MRKWGRPCRCCPGKPKFPHQVGSGASRSRDGDCGSGSRAGPGMMGEEKPSGGAPAWRGGHLFLEKKGGPGWGGFIVRLCLHPELNESNDLVYCRPPEWTAQGEEGGMGMGGIVLLLILPFTTSSSSSFLFFFPIAHCCHDKRIKGETLFLPFPISAVFSKSPGRSLLG